MCNDIILHRPEVSVIYETSVGQILTNLLMWPIIGFRPACRRLCSIRSAFFYLKAVASGRVYCVIMTKYIFYLPRTFGKRNALQPAPRNIHSSLIRIQTGESTDRAELPPSSWFNKSQLKYRNTNMGQTLGSQTDTRNRRRCRRQNTKPPASVIVSNEQSLVTSRVSQHKPVKSRELVKSTSILQPASQQVTRVAPPRSRRIIYC